MDYLLKAGHRDLLVLGGNRGRSDTSSQRYAGCVDAYARNGLHFDESRYHTCRFSFQSGYETMKQALEHGVPCTAVFAMADVIAIGAIRAIREFGLRVPEDISVVGYDGLDIGDFLQPRLTTITQPTELLTRRSADLLLEQVEQGTGAAHITLPFALSCKESVRLGK